MWDAAKPQSTYLPFKVPKIVIVLMQNVKQYIQWPESIILVNKKKFHLFI